MGNAILQTASFWYSKFQVALMEKDFKTAEECFYRYHYWKRRADLNDYLTEICETKEFNNGRK